MRRVVVVVVVALAVAIGLAWSFTGASAEYHLRIGTGGAGGTYLPLGTGLAEVFTASLPGQVVAEAVQTGGSGDNVDRLARGEVELAIVQNDTEVGPDVRAVAPLYPEVLHVVVRHGAGIATLRDLAGRATSAGPEGSGTDVLAVRVLEHFGLPDLGDALLHCTTTETVDRFEAGELDAAFLVSGLKSSAVARLLAGDGELLSLGDPAQVGSALDGLRVSYPFLSRAVIPARTYGAEPVAPVGSVAVAAVLVARSDLPDALVYHLTASIFSNRVVLMRAHRAAANLSEQFDPSDLQAPLHPGAEQYYRRDTPPAYVQYADFLSLVLTIALAAGSGLLAAGRWIRQMKKDRIDVYYLDINAIMQAWDDGGLSTPEAVRKLTELRRRAFRELVDERLSADQSFTIFQDYVTSELAKLGTAP